MFRQRLKRFYFGGRNSTVSRQRTVRKRAMQRALLGLDDHILQDIGLTRSEITDERAGQFLDNDE
ncbi:MAG: DUF1127 domain-containing protein [Pseudomonadota bacterium]